MYHHTKFENDILKTGRYTANEQTDKQKDYTLPPFGEVQQRLAH